MRWFKIIASILLFFTIAIQFIQPAQNNNGQVLKIDIIKLVNVPKKVQGILKRSCYDCHSNKTEYPWYSKIQPGGWWLASHIKKGKEELNFSEFGSYSNRRQLSKLKSVGNQIKDSTMPLSSYILIHNNAKLDQKEKDLLLNWIQTTRDSLLLKK